MLLTFGGPVSEAYSQELELCGQLVVLRQGLTVESRWPRTLPPLPPRCWNYQSAQVNQVGFNSSDLGIASRESEAMLAEVSRNWYGQHTLCPESDRVAVLCVARRPRLDWPWIGSLFCQVTAHWEKFMATVSPEEEAADKLQADFVRSAVRDVHYGPESLSEFTQWRVCHWGDTVLGVGFPGSCLSWGRP